MGSFVYSSHFACFANFTFCHWNVPNGSNMKKLWLIANICLVVRLLFSLAEDLDDLRMEGVTSVISSGSKFNQTRSTHTAEPQAKVTLNICARCAR